MLLLVAYLATLIRGESVSGAPFKPVRLALGKACRVPGPHRRDEAIRRDEPLANAFLGLALTEDLWAMALLGMSTRDPRLRMPATPTDLPNE